MPQLFLILCCHYMHESQWLQIGSLPHPLRFQVTLSPKCTFCHLENIQKHCILMKSAPVNLFFLFSCNDCVKSNMLANFMSSSVNEIGTWFAEKRFSTTIRSHGFLQFHQFPCSLDSNLAHFDFDTVFKTITAEILRL